MQVIKRLEVQVKSSELSEDASLSKLLSGGVGSGSAESCGVGYGNLTYHGWSKVFLLLPCHCVALWLLYGIVEWRRFG